MNIGYTPDIYVNIYSLVSSLVSTRELQNRFHHFVKIHRSVFRKIKIDLLYFWDVYDVIYEKKFLAEAWLIQYSVYNLIILKKKQWTQMKTKQLR